MQGGPFPPTYTPPQSGNGAFESSTTLPQTTSKSNAPKKKRKKTALEADTAGPVGASPPDGDKEKRMKTGRACDACVSLLEQPRLTLVENKEDPL